ncbi:hypothetical protein [Helicobacter saguini]|uniref:hypothetical protein n=1 Tax=Helicobacter saguini TaxID=1548018 RepID=UPI000A7279F4|nr:hypothetical protein [Helicobacter saguini]
MKYSLVVLIFFSVFFSACSKYSEQVKREYDGHFYTHLYKTLHTAKKDKDNDRLLWEMQSSFLTFSYFGPYFAFDDLEKAENIFKVYESQGILSGIGANVAASLSNDLAMPYRGYIFEGALLNYYEALAYSSVGDDQNARIRFNRANDRQRRAKDYYAKEIKKAHDEAVEQANKEKENDAYAKNTSDANIDRILNEKYSNLRNFAAYQNLINPAIPYVSGIYFMIVDDYPKAQDLLKEAYGISRAKIAAQDMQILESRKGRKDFDKYTWIIIEDGNLARKSPIELSIPLIMGSGMNAVNFALPTLDEGRKNFYNYRVNEYNADLISDMSALFASEFEKHLSSIITRAIIGMIVKSLITESMNQMGTYGQLAGLVTSLAFSATNAADTRSSIVLPDSVYIARVPNSQSQIQVFGDNREILNMQIDFSCDSLKNRMMGGIEFNKLIESKPNDLKGRIAIFAKYDYDNKVCASSDNIVYVRVRDGTITHFILKGD